MDEPDLQHDPFENFAPQFSTYYPAGDRATIEFLFSRKLILAARRWVHFIDNTIQSATGQTRARWQTLFAIRFSDPPVTTVMLAHQLGVRWPALVRTLGQLEREGLIEKFDNPEDGRSRIIRMTAKGRKMFETIKAILDPRRNSVLAGLSDHELVGATEVIDRFLIALVQQDGGG